MIPRLLAATVLAIASMAPATSGNAAARANSASRASTVRLNGRVGAVTVSAGAPTAFVLQTARRTYSIHIAPYATFTALSAEAEVEGLVSGDYADVLAKHLHRGWIATKIIFDVQPVQIAPVTLAATVVRFAPDGTYVVVRLASGSERRVAITSHTRFRMDGQVAAAPFALNPGDVVEITMRLQGKGWVAMDINLQHTPPPVASSLPGALRAVPH